MPLLRLLFAGLVALFAMAAVLFTAALVFVTGLVGWIAQLFGGKPRAARPGADVPRRANRSMRTDDVIDVETTKVPDDRGGR